MVGIEEIDRLKVRLTFEVGPEEFKKGLDHSYNKNKSKIKIQGFRPGKAPRNYVEKLYGIEFLIEDAASFLLPEAYSTAIRTTGIKANDSKTQFRILSASKEEGVVFEAICELDSKSDISNYKGLKYTSISAEPSDEQVDLYIESQREKNARIISVDKPIELNDTATIDFKCMLDGELFEGLTQEGAEISVGQDAIAEGFDEQLVGAKPGQSLNVYIPFPDDFRIEELRGKSAAFNVTVKEVQSKELPPADDEFAQDVSEFETFAEYRESVKGNLRDMLKESVNSKILEDINSQLAQLVECELSDELIENAFDSQINSIGLHYKIEDPTLEKISKVFGSPTEQISEMLHNDIIYTLKVDEALNVVAAKENLYPSPEEVKEKLDEYVSSNPVPEELVQSYYKYFAHEIARAKTYDFLIKNGQPVNAQQAQVEA
ncbi:MAG: trigger factor [Clostridiales bacterium]|jgi:trigger factor|nr:trigger factor [Clostridiales bacterium]